MLPIASALLPTPASPIRPAVMRLALALLYTSGLRLGELLRLQLSDVDAQVGVLRVRESKFNKSRWVPLSPSAQSELADYLKIRLRTGYDGPQTPLLCHRRRGWHPYSATGMHEALTRLFEKAAVHGHDGRRPRVHDLRHSFAVETLRRWYAEGADVQVNLPKLAIYMGHVSIVSTAYYLRWMPSVLAHASLQFERQLGSLVTGECP